MFQEDDEFDWGKLIEGLGYVPLRLLFYSLFFKLHVITFFTYLEARANLSYAENAF